MASPSPKDWLLTGPKLLAKKSAELTKKILVGDSKGDHTSPTPLQPVPQLETEFKIPDVLLQGTAMTKVSGKSHKKKVFKLDPDGGCILYNKSGKTGIVPIETITEIRSGSNARYDRLHFKLPEDVEARWITVIYILEGTYKTFHLIAETREIFAMWDAALRKLLAVRHRLMSGLGNVEVRQAVWERQYWKGADQQGDQKLDFGEVVVLCKRLNTCLDAKELRRLFDAADTKAQGYLNFEEFQVFVKLLKKRPDIEVLYQQLCNTDSGKFDFVAFEKFMRDMQKSKLNQDQLKVIFARHASPLPISDTQTSLSASSAFPTSQATVTELTLDDFSNFLLSQDNAPFSDHSTDIWQDMSQPISSYYISSSHNTYLVGHQLVGVSTVEGYIRALLHGCRSVELDIYDGDPTVGPLVFHGNTLTSSVSLRNICSAIARYAFVTSPFPVLISAEIHCSIEQQDMMARIMDEVFGDTLVRAPVEGREPIERLPSPEDLRGKILLKAKNLYVVAEIEALRSQKHLSSPTPKLTAEVERPPSPSSSASDESDSNAGSGKLGKLKAKLLHVSRRSQSNPAPKMSLKLVAFIVYTVGVQCHGLKPESGVKYAPEHIFSLSESSALKILKGDGPTGGMRDLIKHNQGHLVRIYPDGLRVGSTNYAPHRLWAAGAQLVAINWQTFDLGYTINQAMFQRNGRSGYVLKPAALREGGDELLSKYTKHFLDVTIISAQQVPLPKNSLGQEIVEKSVVDPFVQVSVYIPDWTHTPFIQSSEDAPLTLTSASVEAHTVSASSKAVKNNGFNPVWQEKLSLPFDCVGDMRELVFVQFAVRQAGSAEEHEPLAMYCTPLRCLESGYRHLPLHDAQLTQFLFSTLFVKIDVRDA
ncbi:PLC-like phosphodiesterase [Tricholoma matsutake]|nr:PLC-like phosphodiesterase [Tricholoma matsutake 945]